MLKTNCLAKIIVLTVLMMSCAAVGETPVDLVNSGLGVFPVNDTMTVLPGPACPFPDGVGDNDLANRDYGGSGSRSVASASAGAYSLAEGIDHDPKGLFRSVLRFDSAELPGMSLETLALNLYIINGNRGAFDLYNYVGHEGYFTVSLISDQWIQGVGSPHSGEATIADTSIIDAYEADPLTHNNLDAMLADCPPIELATLYYSAAVPYADGAVWYSFDLTDALSNVDFSGVLSSGETFSLMLSPTWIDEDLDGINDNQISFNFSARNQINENGTIKRRDDSVLLSYTAVPEPASMLILCCGFGVLLGRKADCDKAQ